MNGCGEPGPACCRNVGDIARLYSCVMQRYAEGRNDGVEVSSRCDFGNDSPELRVLRGGGCEALAEELSFADDSESGFVTRGFDSEDDGAHCHSDMGLR